MGEFNDGVNWFFALSDHDRTSIGSDEFEWPFWFDEEPSPEFIRGVENTRAEWEIELNDRGY